MRKIIVFLIVLQSTSLLAQTISTPIPVPFSIDQVEDDWEAENDNDYKPYDDEEFAQWQLDLRRAEIIAIGTVPFSIFLASLGYEVGEYVHSGFNESYVPWVLRDPTDAARIRQFDNRTETILLISAGLSIGFAVLDYILGLGEEE